MSDGYICVGSIPRTISCSQRNNADRGEYAAKGKSRHIENGCRWQTSSLSPAHEYFDGGIK
jgi:hypothetical protein